MEEIKLVLRRASLRMLFTEFLRLFTFLVAVALSAAVLLRVAEQLLGFSAPWRQILIYSPAGVLLLSAALAQIRRADRNSVARRVDEGAGLRESISTALFVSGAEDPWSRAVVETAVQRARGVDVRRAVPVTSPRFWPVPVALALALAIVWVSVPQMDVLGQKKAADAKKEELREIVEAKTQADQVEKKIQEVASKLDLTEEKPDAEAPDAEKPVPKEPEAIRREAIRKATNLKERIEQMKEGEKGQQMEAMKDSLRQLRTPGDGPLSEMSRQLSRGNFDKAGEELDKLKSQLLDSKLSKEQQQQLGEQLKKLADQLEQLAQERSELEKELEKLGLDKQLAADPEALKKALEKMQNLSQEQKDQLAKKSQSQSKSAKACKAMASACKNAGQSAMKGEMLDASEGLAQLGEQLEGLEQLAAEMDMADSALADLKYQMSELMAQCNSQCQGMGECENGGIGEWKEGETNRYGNGQGGPGKGRGSGIGEKEAAIDREKKKFKSKLQAGPIVSSMLVEGDQVRGESSAEFVASVEMGVQGATEDIDENVIPREYQDSVKSYYGRLKAKVEARELKDAGGTPAPEAPDKKEEPAKPAGN